MVSTERSGLEFGFGCTCLVGEYNGAFGGELNKVFNGGEVVTFQNCRTGIMSPRVIRASFIHQCLQQA